MLPRAFLLITLLAFSGSPAAADDASCANLIAQLSTLAESHPPALSTLQDAILRSEQANGYINHKLEIVDGKGHLTIGLLESSSTDTFMITAYQAVKEGSINSINAGTLVGPKVIPMLERLRKAAPAGSSLKITGTLEPRELMRDILKKTTNELSTNPQKRVDQFSRAESNKFLSASRAIGLTDACKKLFGKNLTKCRKLTFEIDTSAPTPYKWTAAPDER